MSSFSDVISMFCLFSFSMNNPIYTIFAFIFLILSMGVTWYSLDVPVFSFMLIIIYVGAIAILFLFMVMLLNINVYESSNVSLFWSNFFVIVFIIYNLYYLYELFVSLDGQFFDFNLVYFDNYISYLEPMDWGLLLQEPNVLENLGLMLFSRLQYIPVLCGLLLFIGMLGSIVLTLNTNSAFKRQELFVQNETAFNNLLTFNNQCF